MRSSPFLIVLLSICLLSKSGSAQIDDTRLWTGITLKHKFTRKLTGAVTEQIRFNQDISRVDQIFTEAGAEYEIKKNFKVALNYRFINKNKDTYYSKSHRIYADLSYKYKPARFAFTIRERLQEEYTSINSSENGKIPEWALRSKLTIAYDTESRYKPYAEFEMYYLIKNSKNDPNGITRYRYSTGVEYEFNRIHSIDLGLIFQDYLYSGTNCFIYSVSYTYTL